MPNRRFPRLVAACVVAVGPTFIVLGSTAEIARAAPCTPVSSTVGTDTVLKFTSTGSCTWSVPAGVTQVRALVIGGGGAGGRSTNVGGSGGGGAGAMVVHSAFAVSGNVTVTVGAGGATTTTWGPGENGSSSSLGALVAIGGGGGGDWCDSYCVLSRPPAPQVPGADGGSGGGSGAGLANSLGGNVTSQSLPAGATSYGNKGGDAVSGGNFHGAGGGGAGAAGANRTSSSNPPTAGGIGRQSDITGTNTYYAAGGGGSGGATSDYAAGGTGGGGSGGGYSDSPAATAGQANTGSGGGGGQAGGGSGSGGAGGSGVVIVRFATVPVNSVAPSISGTLQTGDVLTASTGTWAGAPVSYAYQWKSAATAGGTYTDIATAVSSTYTLTDDDIGRHLKVEVTATNVNGAGNPELSSSVGPVTDMPAGVTPVLGPVTSTNDGFTFPITNYSGTYTYSFLATSGSASQTAGTVTVTGLSPSASSTVTVRANRTGYRQATATVTGTARAAATTTTVAPTTTLGSATTTTSVAASSPALEIVVNAPTTTVASAPVTVAASTMTTVRPTVPTVTSMKAATAAPTTTVAPTTTTTMPGNAGGTVAPAAPKIPVVAAGEAGVSVGETTQKAVVTRADDQLVITAGEVTATIGTEFSDGTPGKLDPDGNVRLRAGDRIKISLTGFKPGSRVEVWMFSTPVLLGATEVGYDGRVTGSFAVPQGAPSGAHRIAVVARTYDDRPATLAVGVLLGSWDKGPNVTVWLIVMPIVLAVVGALTLPATRRRRRTA